MHRLQLFYVRVGNVLDLIDALLTVKEHCQNCQRHQTGRVPKQKTLAICQTGRKKIYQDTGKSD